MRAIVFFSIILFSIPSFAQDNFFQRIFRGPVPTVDDLDCPANPTPQTIDDLTRQINDIYTRGTREQKLALDQMLQNRFENEVNCENIFKMALATRFAPSSSNTDTTDPNVLQIPGTPTPAPNLLLPLLAY
jgi:hypothetical protein